jgi:hypothetical protein
MKNQEGQNQGQKANNISIYSLAKTLKECFPAYYKEVLEYYQVDTPLSLIPDFFAWYEDIYGSEQDQPEEEKWRYGSYPNAEYRDQLTICVVTMFHSTYFNSNCTTLRKGVRSALSSYLKIDGSTISHKLNGMRFQDGKIVPTYLPMINSAKIICDTYCCEKGIKKTFEIEDQLAMESIALQWQMKKAMETMDEQTFKS